MTAVATNVLPITATPSERPPAVPAALTTGAADIAAMPLVSGLPDFTQLVDRVGPAVVNIEASSKPDSRAMTRRGGGAGGGEEEIFERFRDFFGPDMPFPGMPGGPRSPEGRPRGQSQGSGFLISADGDVLTNHHVVAGADQIVVKLSDRREFKARLVGSDEQSDVAVLKIDARDLPFLRIGDSETLKPGQWVVAIGSPFGLDHSVTAGVVSGVGRAANPQQRYVPFIQTDVAINPGNSGGPLLNTHGEAVGINSQIFSNFGGYMGVSFSIPMDVAMNVVQQLKTTGKVTRGQIGVVVGQVTSDAARGFGLPDTRGALINDVRPGSPAEKAGIEPGDVIRAVDRTPIDESTDLPPVIGAMAPGSTVTLKIMREGKLIERKVTLDRLEESVADRGQDRAKPKESASTGPHNPLGLVGQDLAAEERSELGLRGGEGVAIARIDGDAAQMAGLRPGDIVLRVGSATVGNAQALDRELSKIRPGQTIMLLVRRGAATQFVAVPFEDKG